MEQSSNSLIISSQCTEGNIYYSTVHQTIDPSFCLLEVGAKVVAVQPPYAECTAIFTACIVEYRPPPCTVTMNKTRLDQQ